MDKQEQESRNLYHRKTKICSLKGCNNRTITLRLETFHDDESPDRQAQFCCESHLIVWTLLYGFLESTGWTAESKDISKLKIDAIEGIVEELMKDMTHYLGRV